MRTFGDKASGRTVTVLKSLLSCARPMLLRQMPCSIEEEITTMLDAGHFTQSPQCNGHTLGLPHSCTSPTSYSPLSRGHGLVGLSQATRSTRLASGAAASNATVTVFGLVTTSPTIMRKATWIGVCSGAFFGGKWASSPARDQRSVLDMT